MGGGGGGGGWGWLDKSIIMLISAPVGFELGLGAELGNNGKSIVKIYEGKKARKYGKLMVHNSRRTI